MSILRSPGLLPLVGAVLFALAACGNAEPPLVRSHLSGTISVSAAIDSVQNFSMFDVFVISRGDGDADTLGLGSSDAAGAFSLDISAPDRGLYPLLVSREGTILHTGEVVVADGDSGTVNIRFPLGTRPLIIRSPENAAWMAYRNVKAQHNHRLVEVVRAGQQNTGQVDRTYQQTSAILWSLREAYPNTLAAELAAAEAIVMVDGINDSLVVARTAALPLHNTSIVDAVRAARRATARLAGLDSSLALIRSYEGRLPDPERKAALASEVVLAYLDSLRYDDAAASAQAMKERYAETDWADWADQALYEFEHLRPGRPAPPFEVVTRQGQTLRLDERLGDVVLLEFYVPGSQAYQRELATRNAIANVLAEENFSIISVSLEPDDDLNDAFHEGRDLPGYHVVAPGGMDDPMVRAYNVNVIPTRFLIDPEGKIIGKYAGATLNAIDQDLAVLYTPVDGPERF